MHTAIKTWAKALSLALISVQSVTAHVPSLRPRDAKSDLQALMSAGGNTFSFEQDSIKYNLTLQIDPNCPNAINESDIIGPYQDSQGRYIENATLGDLASDANTTPIALLYRSTRRNLAKAQSEINDLLSEVLLCDDKDYQFSVQLHDELRRRKLLQDEFTQYVMTFFHGTYGFVFAAGATWAIKTIISDNDTAALAVSAGFIAFISIFFSSGVIHLNAARNDRMPVEMMIANILAAFGMRIARTIRRLQAAGVGLVGGAGVAAGAVAAGGVADIEMGNAGQMNGHGNGDGVGGKLRRDGSSAVAAGAACVSSANATASMFGIAGVRSDDLGLLSWNTLSQAAGTCHM